MIENITATTTRTTIPAGKTETTTTPTKRNLSKTNEVLTSASTSIPTPISIQPTSTSVSAITSTTLLGTSSKVLLKKQLHLNLNVISNENTKKVVGEDKRSRGICKLPSKAETVEGITAEALRLKDDVSNLETTTVTTVPQIQKKQQKSILEASKPLSVAASSSSSSLLNSSPSALAKFNRIIDSTMPITDCYQQQKQPKQQQQQEKQQQQQQKQENGIFTKIDSKTNRKIDFPSGYDGDHDEVGLNYELDNVDVTTKVVNENEDNNVDVDNDEIVLVPNAEHKIDEKDDNQMKRNDVHYLLKQLNSFSDIEEIEIVDMKQRRQQQAVAARSLATATAAVITHSPTTTSLVIISPSSQSHKESRHVMRRFASLHQQHQYSDEQNHYSNENQYEHKNQRQWQRQQYRNHRHNYREQQQSQNQQKRHYTLNASGGNLLERFDPAADQQYLLQQFDDYLFESCHYLETNYFAATYRTAMIESSSHEFRPSTTTGTRSSPSAASSPHSYEIHEIELPSVVCRAPPPPPSPTRRFNTQARLTSCGVQTELTASSLTTTSTSTTTTSHATAESTTKSSIRSNGASACSSYTSSTEQRRRMPFFKCCYASIDRWREKRNANSNVTDGGSENGGKSLEKPSSGSSRTKNEIASATTHSSDSRRKSQRQQKKKQHTQTRKGGNAV